VGHRHQISTAFNLSGWSRRRHLADTTTEYQKSSGALLAGFYRKGHAACSRSNFLHQLITWNPPRTSHEPSDLPFLLIFQLPSSAFFNINIHVFTFLSFSIIPLLRPKFFYQIGMAFTGFSG
jgi:hypothetical protein